MHYLLVNVNIWLSSFHRLYINHNTGGSFVCNACFLCVHFVVFFFFTLLRLQDRLSLMERDGKAVRSDGLKVERTTIVAVPGYCLQFKGQPRLQVASQETIIRTWNSWTQGAFLWHKSSWWTVGRRQRRSAGSLDDERGQEKPYVGAHVWGGVAEGWDWDVGVDIGSVVLRSSICLNRMGGQLQSSRDTRNWPKSWSHTNGKNGATV